MNKRLQIVNKDLNITGRGLFHDISCIRLVRQKETTKNMSRVTGNPDESRTGYFWNTSLLHYGYT
jgi:hypothetical protein